MDRHSDLEELLEDSESRPARLGFPNRVLLVLGVVALAALALFSVKGSKLSLRSKGSFVALVEEDDDAKDAPVSNCFEMGMYYADPVKMDATDRTVELSAELCQQRCQVVPFCSHFTYWPDGGCLLTDEASFAKAAPFKYSATQSGPKFCPGAIQDAKDAIAAATDAVSSGLQQPSSGVQDSKDAMDAGLHAAAAEQTFITSGIKQAEEAWATADDDKSKTEAEVAAVSPGVNGTMCSAYPACVDVGIKEGACCPNADNVILGCCDGFPKTVVEEIVQTGTECSKYPKCAALNITGGCCPTRDGLMLGCCDSI